jgi:hypothetical protein
VRIFWLESAIWNIQSQQKRVHMTKFSVQHAKQGCALTPASSSYRQLELSPPPPPQNKSSELQIYTPEMGGETNPQHLVAQEPEFCLQVSSYSSIITNTVHMHQA